MWDEIKLAIDTFMNSPVATALISAAGFIGGIFAFFKNTSFGKKAINEAKKLMTEKTEEVTIKANEIEKITKEIQDEVKEFENDFKTQYDEFANKLEEQVNLVYSEFELYREELFVILESIPNKKVQEQVQVLKEKLNNANVTELLSETYSSMKQKYEEDANAKILAMNDKLLELENKLNEVLNNGEERKESEDTDSAQENA